MGRIFCTIAVCLLLWTGAVCAQDKQGILMGLIRDSAQAPVPYATVLLQQKGQVVKTTYTNSKGKFELKSDTGRYTLTVTHLSFSDFQSLVTIGPGEQVLDTLVLTKGVNVLQQVTVSARKILIEQKDDRVIYNAENDPAAKTESATDILRKTPLLTVDGDGNIQLNGQANFRILLNGRETSLFALNAKDALKSFPGAVISKIEVITSPSAKYDAEGIGGIINIITKKKMIGYNGSVNASFSTFTNNSENISLSVKTGKLGITGYAGTSGPLNYITSGSNSVTTTKASAAFLERRLTGERERKNTNIQGNLELVYDIDSFNVVAVYGNLSRNRLQSNYNQSIFTQYSAMSSGSGTLSQHEAYTGPSSGFGTDYIRKFRNRPEQELSFRINGQFSNNNGNTSSEQQGSTLSRYVSNDSRVSNREFTLQADYVQPLSGGQKIETGAKAILRDAYSDFTSNIKYQAGETFKPDPFNSDRFRYSQQVYGAYSSYSLQLKKGFMRLGLRLEHTVVNGDFETSGTGVQQRYTNLVPNFLITRKISTAVTLTGSYNMRLQRPFITNLNPFVNNNDSLNISYGNPGLEAQVLHAVSLQTRVVKGNTFVAMNLNASYTNDMIVQYAIFDPATGVTSITSANYGRERQLALILSVNTPVSTKFNIGINSQLRYNKIENRSNLLQQNEGFSGALFSNFFYKVVGRFTISGSGGILRGPYALVNSPAVQGFYQVNFGYKFFKDKLAFSMNVNNFHNRWLVFESVTEDPSFRTVSTNINPYRVVYFSATFTFGKLKENVSKKKGVNNDDLL